MRVQVNRWAIASALASCLMLCGSAFADTLINSFDNYTLGGVYAAWSDPNVTTITSNPTNLEIESIGFGGGFAGLDPFPINATGETDIRFDVTINSGDAPNVLFLLHDVDSTQYVYRFYGLAPGNHVLTAPINPVPTAGVPGVYDAFLGSVGDGILDLSTLYFMHLQVDAHGSEVPYNISFNDLQLTHAVPEPTALALLATGGFGLVSMFVRRRVR